MRGFKIILLVLFISLISPSYAYNESTSIRDGFKLWQYGNDINLNTRTIHNGSINATNFLNCYTLGQASSWNGSWLNCTAFVAAEVDPLWAGNYSVFSQIRNDINSSQINDTTHDQKFNNQNTTNEQLKTNDTIDRSYLNVTFPGSTVITILGTIATGTWQGTAISDVYVASSTLWNSYVGKIDANNASILYLNNTALPLKSDGTFVNNTFALQDANNSRSQAVDDWQNITHLNISALNESVNFWTGNASNLTLGTISKNRMPANVTYNDSANVFTSENNFTGTTNISTMNLNNVSGAAKINTSAKQLDLVQLGDDYGCTGLSLMSRKGAAGAKFYDFPCPDGHGLNLELVDFIFQTISSPTSVLRLEYRQTGNDIRANNYKYGEIQFMQNTTGSPFYHIFVMGMNNTVVQQGNFSIGNNNPQGKFEISGNSTANIVLNASGKFYINNSNSTFFHNITIKNNLTVDDAITLGGNLTFASGNATKDIGGVGRNANRVWAKTFAGGEFADKAPGGYNYTALGNTPDIYYSAVKLNTTTGLWELAKGFGSIESVAIIPADPELIEDGRLVILGGYKVQVYGNISIGDKLIVSNRAGVLTNARGLTVPSLQYVNGTWQYVNLPVTNNPDLYNKYDSAQGVAATVVAIALESYNLDDTGIINVKMRNT